jgi:5-methylcytosine-specific restriction endonuclease McrBC regulatory subunit McrC
MDSETCIKGNCSAKTEAVELFEKYKSELLEAKSTRQSTNMLSTKDENLSAVRGTLNEATAELEEL